MPIYEYRCRTCGLRQSVLYRSFANAPEVRCRRCGGGDLQKLVSSFYALKSEDAQLENLADPSQFGDVDENDPRSVARWARRMARETGEEMGPEFDEMVDRLEAGETPDEGEAEGVGSADAGEGLADL